MNPLRLLGLIVVSASLFAQTQGTASTQISDLRMRFVAAATAAGWLRSDLVDIEGDADVSIASSGKRRQVHFAADQQLRLRTQDRSTGAYTISNRASQSLVAADGSRKALSGSANPPIFLPPFSRLRESIDSPSRLTLKPHDCCKLTLLNQKNETVLEISLDPATALPTEITEALAATSNPSATLWLTTRLSDYRSVDGVLFPFRTEVYQGNRLLHVVQLQSIRINPGLPGSTFLTTDVQEVQ